jgi:HTH-type transcriptional regulator, sugar sensing transcriptional regulator
MNKPIIFKRFKELGLGTNEAKSYISLLERDIMSVTEIARLAKIPRANAYEALETLLAKGFCISRPGKIRQYSALDPVLLQEKAILLIDNHFEGEISKLQDQQEQILAEKKAARERLARLAKDLKPLYHNSRSNGNPMDYIEIIKDPFQIHKKFIELIGEARREVLIFSKAPYTGPREVLKEQTDKQSEPLRKGITIKTIYEIPSEKNELEWWYNDIVAAVGLGEKARVIKTLPMKMVVIDEMVVMLPMEDPISSKTSFTAQIITHNGLAKTLKYSFETLWEQAENYQVMESLIYNNTVEAQ